MIILDTNIISEPMRPSPDQTVIAWLDAQIAETLYTTSITLAELLTGVSLLPEGKRKAALEETLHSMLENLFAGRILSFTSADAEHHASVVAIAKASGHTMSFADAQIAAIAKSHEMKVATRNVLPFSAAGIETINPWHD